MAKMEYYYERVYVVKLGTKLKIWDSIVVENYFYLYGYNLIKTVKFLNFSSISIPNQFQNYSSSCTVFVQL